MKQVLLPVNIKLYLLSNCQTLKSAEKLKWIFSLISRSILSNKYKQNKLKNIYIDDISGQT